MKKGKILLLALAGYVAYKVFSKKSSGTNKLTYDYLFKKLRLIELQTDSTEDAIKETQKFLNANYNLNYSLDMAGKVWSAYLINTNANPEQFDAALRRAGLLSSAAGGGGTLMNL